jgi:hypothetical protein
MKKIVLVLLFFLIQFSFQSCCFYGDCGREFPESENYYKPVIMNRPIFESSIKILANKTIAKSGKIYIKDDVMLLNDVNKGFHIYNYSDATNPVKIAFLEIPGATDVAIRNSTIYINQAVDLVTLKYDLSANKVTVLYRNKNIFPQKISPQGFRSSVKENEIIIDWIPN